MRLQNSRGVYLAMEFRFPDVGEGIHEGTVVKWHFKEGDSVKADQTIVEVETDKAIVELPSPATGTILKRYFMEGQVIKVGQLLVAIGEAGEVAPVDAPMTAVHEAPKQQTPLQAVRAPVQQQTPQAQQKSTPLSATCFTCLWLCEKPQMSSFPTNAGAAGQIVLPAPPRPKTSRALASNEMFS